MSRLTRSLAVAAAGSATLLAALAAPAVGQADPPGNNGTIKVDGLAFDSHPNNEPHPGCIFQIDFYNYDEGDLTATLGFEAIPPTAGGPLLADEVFIGQDPAGGGDDDIDASVTYDLGPHLAGITPHPQQGYHVQLTIHAEGSQGNDVKHKTFWVEACAEAPPSGGPGGPGAPGAPGGVAGAAQAVRGRPSFAG